MIRAECFVVCIVCWVFGLRNNYLAQDGVVKFKINKVLALGLKVVQKPIISLKDGEYNVVAILVNEHLMTVNAQTFLELSKQLNLLLLWQLAGRRIDEA